LGIPDFRLTDDPWLSIDKDRAKAIRLEQCTSGQSFAEMVASYWKMTPSTPAARAEGFIDHVLRAEHRTGQWLQAAGLLDGGTSGSWLDLGCGTGDLGVSAHPGQIVIAIDIALRWLVVARRRLAERGCTNVYLACANANALPLPDASIGCALSLGLFEHLADVLPVVQEARRVLVGGGELLFRTTNRYSLLPEPHVGLWGVGFLPRPTAIRYVRWRTGERFDTHHPHSARELRKALREAGFGHVSVRPARALDSDIARFRSASVLATPYNRCAAVPVLSRGLSWVAPLLDGRCVA
jgi:ubiquinone/menaquinone biosynthesis C-methylase UbiE